MYYSFKISGNPITPISKHKIEINVENIIYGLASIGAYSILLLTVLFKKVRKNVLISSLLLIPLSLSITDLFIFNRATQFLLVFNLLPSIIGFAIMTIAFYSGIICSYFMYRHSKETSIIFLLALLSFVITSINYRYTAILVIPLLLLYSIFESKFKKQGKVLIVISILIIGLYSFAVMYSKFETSLGEYNAVMYIRNIIKSNECVFPGGYTSLFYLEKYGVSSCSIEDATYVIYKPTNNLNKSYLYNNFVEIYKFDSMLSDILDVKISKRV
jgi:hypothetical protein